MQILQGIAVSPGVTLGEALIVDNEGFRIPRRFVRHDAVEDELRRLHQAIEAAGDEIASHRDAVTDELGGHYGAIFSAHLQMLKDPQLSRDMEALVRQQHSPELAVSRTLRRYAKVFQQLKTFHEHDILDLERALLRQLLGSPRKQLSNLSSPVVILAHSLTPSETAMLDRQFVRGFVTEIGGAGGHTAIVARALEIPAVVGTGPFLVDLSGGEHVIIDGDLGQVVIDPDEETRERYVRGAEKHRSFALQLEQLWDLPAETQDGQQVELDANIEFPHEAPLCLKRGASGIGLYRTEFLYMDGGAEPTEEVHFEAYREVVLAMQGRPVVIRTLDLGADKLSPHTFNREEERNPFLGLRSIRLSLKDVGRFGTQLRAALRASALGPVRIMFPLVSTLDELRRARLVLSDAMEDLDEQNIPFDRETLVGMMVEVPAAVTMIDRFLPEVDFISIGTNDLVQYALAVDRGNSEVAHLYRASNPAVLRMIQTSIDAARAAGKAATVCGQMSSEAPFTMLLLGMGLRKFSIPPSAIPQIKKVCRSVTLEQCRSVRRRVMAMDGALEIESFLREELRKAVPELLP